MNMKSMLMGIVFAAALGGLGQVRAGQPSAPMLVTSAANTPGIVVCSRCELQADGKTWKCVQIKCPY